MERSRLRTATVPCPCCGFTTLHERAGYDICRLCWWEDDGQDDPHADEVRGGPNGEVSLSEARRNFRDHLTMYRSGADSRIGGEDSPQEVRAKRAIIQALSRVAAVAPESDERDRLWQEIDAMDAVLEAETRRKIQEHEAADDRGA